MEKFTINRDKKTFLFDDGEELPIPKDEVKEVLRTPHAKKAYEEEYKYRKKLFDTSLLPSSVEATKAHGEEIFGNLPITGSNYFESILGAFKGGEGREKLGFFDKVTDEFKARQDARKKVLQEIEEKHPTASMIGKGVALGGEIFATRKLPAAVALPIIGAGESETSFLEPIEKGKELGKDAVIGYLLDRFLMRPINRVAQERGARRAMGNTIKQTEAANVAETQRAGAATQAEKTRFTTETAARDAEVQKVAAAQQAENQAFAQTSAQEAEQIAKTIGNDAIAAESLGIEEFIENTVNRSSNAATSEANFVSKFLNTIFKGDKNGRLSANAFKQSMKALDETILKSEGATKQMLLDFRSGLTQNFPERLAQSVTMEKWIPKILRKVGNVTKDITQAFQRFPQILGSMGRNFGNTLSKEIEGVIQKRLGSIQGDIAAQLSDPATFQSLVAEIRELPSYKTMVTNLEKLSSSTKPSILQAYKNEAETLFNFVEQYPQLLAERVSQGTSHYLPDINLDILNKAQRTQKALGRMPQQPNVLPQPAPVAPAQTIQPNLQTVPQMPEPKGMYQKLAAGLENLTGESLKKQAQANAPLGILGKMAGLPVGKTVALASGAAALAKGLTSPTAAGQMARQGLNLATRLAYTVEEKASKYPSYHDGVLDNPQERRSLTKEIEDDQNIPFEDKALLQSKVNRGKSIFERLQ